MTPSVLYLKSRHGRKQKGSPITSEELRIDFMWQ